jgi:hypothetical protein
VQHGGGFASRGTVRKTSSSLTDKITASGCFGEVEGVKNMAKLVFGLQQSLDGYVDHLKMGPPGPRPPLRLVASDLVGEGVIRLTYVPA